MWLEHIKGLFEKEPPKDVYILVREGKTGIETYLNNNVSRFPEAYKDQLISFLKGVLKDLGAEK